MDQNKISSAIKVSGTTSNVYEVEYTLKIDNFQIDKNKCINLDLPCDIHCTLALFKTQLQGKGNFYLQPTLFVNDIKNKNGNYIISYKIHSHDRRTLGISNPHEVNGRNQEGSKIEIKTKGTFITSNNYKWSLDKYGSLMLELSVIVKDLDSCKPDDKKEFASNLTKLLSKYFASNIHSDSTIMLGDDQIPAHKVVLSSQSNILKNMLLNDKECNNIEIKMRYDKECYVNFLRFFYTGTIKDLKQNLDAYNSLAIEYDVKGLINICHMEYLSIVNNQLMNLTKIQRQIPDHIASDSQKIRKMLDCVIEFKEIFKKPSQKLTDEIVETMEFADNAPLPRQEFVGEKVLKDEILTESMTNLIKSIMTPNDDDAKQSEIYIETFEDKKEENNIGDNKVEQETTNENNVEQVFDNEGELLDVKVKEEPTQENGDNIHENMKENPTEITNEAEDVYENDVTKICDDPEAN